MVLNINFKDYNITLFLYCDKLKYLINASLTYNITVSGGFINFFLDFGK